MFLGLDWSGPTTEDPFIIVLAYDRIVEQEDGQHMSQSRLKLHLKTLQDEGFFAIGLQDLWAFYYEHKPLPPKSVLLTFNHGYFSTYTAVDPLLRSFGWHGVMSINTKVLSQRYTYLLYWDRLKRMTKSGIWEIASNGHDSRKTIYVTEQKNEGSFLINRRWLDNENRLETYAEFTDRMVWDHQTSKDIIAENIPGYRVIAYAAPWGRLGRLIDDQKLLSINRQTVKTHYAMAFVDDYFGFNNRYTDPYHIKRLHIDPEWSNKALLAHIHSLLATPTVMGETKEKTDWGWQLGVGEVERDNGQLSLKGTPRADIWIPGSEKAENWMIEAEIELGEGEFWLVQQASDDAKRQWRVGGNERGVFVQHRDWSNLKTLASFPVPIEPGIRHELKVIKRGLGVWVELDGQMLSETPVYLYDRWQGYIGWVAWNKDGEARLQLTSLHLKLYPTKISLISNNPSQEEVQQHIGDAKSIESIAVPMWELRGKRFEQLKIDSNLLALLSRRYCWDMVPILSVDSYHPDKGLIPLAENQAEWLQQVKANSWERIIIDLKSFSAPELKTFEPVLNHLQDDLATFNKCLLVGVSDKMSLQRKVGTSFKTRGCRAGWNTAQDITFLQ